MGLDALIFDVDGTLADTEKDGHRVAFNQAFSAAGLNWNWSVSLYGELLAVSGGKERIRFYIEKYKPDFSPPANLDEFIAELHAQKSEYFGQLVTTGAIPLRPGVSRLIQEAREAGIRLAIATTAALPNVFALLEHHLGEDSPNWFEVIAAGDIVPHKKPAPDIYEYVLEKMNLPATHCLAIEDSAHGLNAALKTGLKTIVTVNKYTQNQDFTGAALVLNHLGEPQSPITILAGEGRQFTYLNVLMLKTFCA